MAYPLSSKGGKLLAPNTSHHPAGGTVLVGTAASSLVVFNTSVMHAQSSPTDPVATVNADATNHARVRIIGVPDCANYLDLYCISDAAPTTYPKIRVFGELPDYAPGELKPADVDAAAYWSGPVSESVPENGGYWISTRRWRPLPDVTGEYNPSLGTATAMAETGSVSDVWSTPVTIELRGSLRIVVLVSNIAVTGITKGLVAGTFNK